MYICTYLCTYVYVNVRVCVHIYIYIYIHHRPKFPGCHFPAPPKPNLKLVHSEVRNCAQVPFKVLNLPFQANYADLVMTGFLQVCLLGQLQTRSSEPQATHPKTPHPRRPPKPCCNNAKNHAHKPFLCKVLSFGPCSVFVFSRFRFKNRGT